MNFEIKLPLFEGPFDLLLFFIERNEIDIYDIPIFQITEEFLGYIRQMETMNIELASEFILVAATLMRIKAKMLLPKDEESEEEDPRQELVNYLLEYKKYKSVLDVFAEMEAEQLMREKRGNVIQELSKVSEIHELDMEMHNLDLYKLLKVYENILNKSEERKNKPTHTVVPYPYTVSGQKEFMLLRLKERKRITFLETIEDNPTKIAVIFNFLAILELLQNRLIILHLGEGFNNFWMEENHQHLNLFPKPENV